MGRRIVVTTDRDQTTTAPAWEPYRDGAQQVENYIDLTELDRVYQSLWYNDHQLTDFLMIQQVKRKSRWSDILKVDCCHQEVHAHLKRQDGSESRKALQAIEAPADMRIGFDKANDLIFKHWDNNLRRWIRGR